MNTQKTERTWSHLDENDPPLDLSREEAAFQRERERLVRDHLGQIALIHDDDVIGAYPTYDAASREGFRRFGLTRWICRPITEKDEPEFIPHMDINHPSVRRID